MRQNMGIYKGQSSLTPRREFLDPHISMPLDKHLKQVAKVYGNVNFQLFEIAFTMSYTGSIMLERDCFVPRLQNDLSLSYFTFMWKGTGILCVFGVGLHFSLPSIHPNFFRSCYRKQNYIFLFGLVDSALKTCIVFTPKSTANFVVVKRELGQNKKQVFKNLNANAFFIYFLLLLLLRP